MNTQYSNSVKLASIPTIALILLSSLFGFVLLVPASPVHAAPAVTLSASSGTVSSSLTITGTGFSSAANIRITTGTTAWLTAGSCTTTNGGTGSANSLVVSSCLTTDADGYFSVKVTVPAMTGGAQTITVSDGTNSATATFTVNSKISIVKAGTTTAYSSGFPGQTQNVDVSISGFGASESVTLTTTSAFSSFGTTSLTTGTTGSASATTVATTVAEATGGAKTVTATGATSGSTASVTFTVNPYVAFYVTQTGTTTFSFLGTTPTSVLVEGHGFTTSTISANSITIGGVATTHSSITPDSTGKFGVGTSNHVVVSPNSNVAFGPVSVVIGSTTFSFANGNINQGAAKWGGVLISSIAGTTSSTGVVLLDKSSYGFGDTVSVFGYGFVAGNTPTISTTNLPGITLGIASGTIQDTNADARGAFFVSTTTGTFGEKAAGSATVTVTGGTVANIISPSYTVKQVLKLSFTDTTTAATKIDYKSTSLTLEVHGFKADTEVKVTAGGATLATVTSTNIGSDGGHTAQAVTTPDLASAQYTATASDSTNSGTDTFTVVPRVNVDGSNTALSVTSGGAGTTTILRTGSTYGVHGLKASTTYKIAYGAASGSQTITTFTTDSKGQVPAPGIQFAVPAGTTGRHIFALLENATGTDALFGTVLADITSSLTGSPTSQYGDLLFSLSVSLTATPTVAGVGSVITLTGSGLAPSTQYVISISTSQTTSGTTIEKTFTSTSGGAVPSATTVTIPETGTTVETGTVKYFTINTPSGFPGTPVGSAQFVLQATATLNASQREAGKTVTITAKGLNTAGAVYSVVFDYKQGSTSTTFTGTVVSAISPNSVGTGSTTFTVPSGTTAGTYTVQLTVSTQGTGGLAVGSAALSQALSLKVVSAGEGQCVSTSCFTVSASPTKTTINNQPVVQASYTNTANAQITGIVYGVVRNAAGQTVQFTTATITPAAGQSVTAFLFLAGLPSGTYSVTVFAITPAGVAISTSSTVSVTI